ncbi:MAG: FAD-dependent monooxygenase [Cypionkella sp.]|uniref:FAD-dependent monooxygenase n=1 Tax=Cypionkella sp. TaxID=2811411 RepID=UPI002ABC9D4B|nr:FAD-dependent monooxygenase [Cypionkella sp.]MDZ4312883.1 FAD-dependent monooxygenase [Cypionkella sp.]
MSIAGQPITVLGAGVGGLAAALALAQKGADVTVLEQADAIREIGAGLQISPNGATVLRALGLSAALDAASMRAQAVELRDGRDGDLVLRLDLARLRPQQGYHFLHRADLIELLAKAARAAGVQIRLLHKIETVDLSGSRPRVVTALGAEFQPSLLIGADGLHSKTRAALNGRTAPFFTRHIAWRCIIPAEAGAAPVAEVHMGAGRHLVSYPLRGGTLRNIVAVEERNAWVEESWSLRDDSLEMKLAFESFSPRVQGWLDQAQDVYVWGLFRHPVAQVWSKTLPEGAAVILGDAAHPTLPFLAQGASMALEDAWLLADRLANLPLAEALSAYQTARKPRCTRIVAAANSNAKTYHLSGPQRSIAHTALRLGGMIAPNLALKRFDWLYDHDVTQS